MHEATWLQVGKFEVYVEIAGDGPAIVCVHTAGQSGVQYRETLQELPDFGYRVIVIDLPGHGRSTPSPDGPICDLHAYAEICWDVIKSLGVTRPFVVGCSIGGKIVLDLCVHHGDALAGGVAMEAESYDGRLSEAGLRRSMSEHGSPSQGERTYFGTLASVGSKVDRERSELVATMHRREDAVITSSDLIGWTTHDLRGRLSEITCPVMAVAGSDDFWVSAERIRQDVASMPHGSFVELQGVGHYPMEEIAGFSAMLDSWLKGLTSSKVDEDSGGKNNG